MDTATLHQSETAPAGPGELVLQNGRQAGTRRALRMPATFLGRDTPSDIRLNVQGVDPIHCVVLCGPAGIELRDLNSVNGTYVNGKQVEQALLKDGDQIKIGPFEFKLTAAPLARPPERPETPPLDHVRESLRIQTAAVAAQQIALDEEEARLREGQQNLHQQEEQLAAHLAEKQRQIQLWSDYTKTERESLRKQKSEHERHVLQVDQGLVQTRQELDKAKETVAEERKRIEAVYQRLRQRWHKQWGAEKEKYLAEAERQQALMEAIAAARRELEVRAKTLREEITRFRGERDQRHQDLETGRETLENARQIWRRRRVKERLALKAKARAVELAELQMQQARQLLIADKDAWRRQQRILESELQGLDRRIIHQRARVQKHEDEIARLDRMMREHRGQVTVSRKDEPETPSVPETEAVGETPAPQPPRDERAEGMERIRVELADQRVQLLEQYNRLAQVHQHWHAQRDQAASELEALAQRLLEREETLAERDQEASAAEDKLRERFEEIEVMRQEIQVWRAQMRARDKASADEHGQHLLAVREKEGLVQEQLTALEQLRQRWKQRRQQEIKNLQANRAQLEQQQRDAASQRADQYAKVQELEEQKRVLTEKALALEQYRQETLGQAEDPVSQRRVERLRRRWLTVNAAMIRSAKSERKAVLAELARLETTRSEVARQLDRLTHIEADLADRQNIVDKREADLRARLVRLNVYDPAPIAEEAMPALERAA